MLFQYLLKLMIHEGSLRLTTADGISHTFGNGESPHATIKLHRKSLEWTLAFYPQLRVGEAYMDGLLTIEEGTLRDFLSIVVNNYHHLKYQALFTRLDRMAFRLGQLIDLTPLKHARRNVSYHYDLSPKIYDLFLDSDRQYSCAYFVNPRVSLEQAQVDKKRHIASKLRLRQGLKVLDIGSGWGGLGLYLARETGCDVTGVTLSDEQLKLSQHRALVSGLAGSCHFALRDYRQEKGPYDRIVSIGMFEHVGQKNYDTFFAKVRDLLTDDGVCLLHSIGRFDDCPTVNPFIRKHIFPGAEVPPLSDVLKAVERSGLFVTDIEVLRLHYAETLKHWNDRFQAHRAEAAKVYDERFCRKWEFYFIGCEMSFRAGHLMVFQLQLTKRLATLPVTRDYMHEWEDLAASMPSLAAEKEEQRQRA